MIMELFLHLSYISQLVFILASIYHQKQLPWNNPRKFSNHISLFGVLVSLGYSDHRNLSSHNYWRSEVCSQDVSRARHCWKNPSVSPPACWWWSTLAIPPSAVVPPQLRWLSPLWLCLCLCEYISLFSLL